MKIYKAAQKIFRGHYTPKASNSSMWFLLYSQQLALVSMVSSLSMSFLPYSKVHAMVAIVTSANDGM
jgi:hypothetical protein